MGDWFDVTCTNMTFVKRLDVTCMDMVIQGLVELDVHRHAGRSLVPRNMDGHGDWVWEAFPVRCRAFSLSLSTGEV